MTNICKLYCLEDRSIIELPYFYGIHRYTTDNSKDGEYAETNKWGTFMFINHKYPAHVEFAICEGTYNGYLVNGNRADILVTNFKIHEESIDYVNLTSSKRMSTLMKPEEDNEQIFSNMIKLSKYLRAFVDHMENFDDVYQE